MFSSWRPEFPSLRIHMIFGHSSAVGGNFLWSGHKLRTLEKRHHQLKNCLHQKTNGYVSGMLSGYMITVEVPSLVCVHVYVGVPACTQRAWRGLGCPYSFEAAYLTETRAAFFSLRLTARKPQHFFCLSFSYLLFGASEYIRSHFYMGRVIWILVQSLYNKDS